MTLSKQILGSDFRTNSNFSIKFSVDRKLISMHTNVHRCLFYLSVYINLKKSKKMS